MFAYMNRESLLKTVETGEVHYWSRSRGRSCGRRARAAAWSSTSAACTSTATRTASIAKVVVGDGNTVPQAACHTGYRSCFYRQVRPDGSLQYVERERAFDPEKVY